MKNILIIENDAAVVEQIISALKNEEYSFDFADSSINGYSIALRKLPEVIICNRQLFQEGFGDNFSSWREESFLSSIPFIYLVNKISRKQESALRSELDYYIRVPFEPVELARILELAIKNYEVIKKKSDEKLNQLRGSISLLLPHEFFTPLNGILGFTDILMKDISNLSKDEITQMLSFIHLDAIRLKKLTENFVTFAQLELTERDQSKITSLRNSYFINASEILKLTAKKIAHDKGRDDDLFLELQDSVIRMSEEYFRKMIIEIIDNAFKFSQKGTAVNINALSNDSGIMIEISDSGIGMKAEQITSIGAYMQFDRKIHEQQGSGLGLVIAKKIAELHGAVFKVESMLEQGTKVTIVFEN